MWIILYIKLFIGKQHLSLNFVSICSALFTFPSYVFCILFCHCWVASLLIVFFWQWQSWKLRFSKLSLALTLSSFLQSSMISLLSALYSSLNSLLYLSIMGTGPNPAGNKSQQASDFFLWFRSLDFDATKTLTLHLSFHLYGCFSPFSTVLPTLTLVSFYSFLNISSTFPNLFLLVSFRYFCQSLLTLITTVFVLFCHATKTYLFNYQSVSSLLSHLHHLCSFLSLITFQFCNINCFDLHSCLWQVTNSPWCPIYTSSLHLFTQTLFMSHILPLSLYYPRKQPYICTLQFSSAIELLLC